jgi:hypothetical protein
LHARKFAWEMDRLAPRGCAHRWTLRQRRLKLLRILDFANGHCGACLDRFHG